MGKVIRAQRLGKSIRRRSLGHRYRGATRHKPLHTSKKEIVRGKVTEIMHDPGRTAPVAKIRYETGENDLIIAPNKLKVGDDIEYGINAKPKLGSFLQLSDIPDGAMVYNIENVPGDGGKFARSTGTFAKVVTHDPTGTVVQLPSGVFKTVDPKCRANIGVVAGGGRTEKPFVKAGKMSFARKARGKFYPRTSGVSMNPTDHPFGGGAHPHPGKPKTVSKHTPPGRKIGSISAKKTGKKR